MSAGPLVISDEHVCAQHGPMVLNEISCGDVVIGYIWFCAMDGLDGREYCDECENCADDEVPPVYPKVGERSRFACSTAT